MDAAARTAPNHSVYGLRSMTAIVFNSGDKPYINWMDKNPDGFVLNTSPSEGSSYLFFHRSGCHHISQYTSRLSDGAFTTNDYVKVCSTSSGDLVDWAAKFRKKGTTYKSCKTCQPEIVLSAPPLAEEVETGILHIEGSVQQVTVNAYERNPRARKACLAHYGSSCVVCSFDFGKVFGAFAQDFIHIHHLVPLSKIGKSYVVNPVNDLRPVCPNCHAAIHLGGKLRNIEQVQEMLARESTEASPVA